MVETTRITVTLPTEQVTHLKKVTDNVSGYVAEAVARQIRHQLLGEELRQYQHEHGAFTDGERAAARSRILDAMENAGSERSGEPELDQIAKAGDQADAA